jgi:hypothetical protein
MSNDQKEQQENLTAVYDLRSHQAHKSVSAVEKRKHTKKSRASLKDSQTSLEEAQQAGELAALLENLELENLEVFEETETAHLSSHGEKLQTATEIALLPSAPELAEVEQQSEPQSHTIKPEPNKSPSKGAEHDVQHTYTIRPLSPLTPLIDDEVSFETVDDLVNVRTFVLVGERQPLEKFVCICADAC